MKQAPIILIGFIIPIVIILQMFLIFHNIETSPKEEEKPIFTDSSTSGPSAKKQLNGATTSQWPTCTDCYVNCPRKKRNCLLYKSW